MAEKQLTAQEERVSGDDGGTVGHAGMRKRCVCTGQRHICCEVTYVAELQLLIDPATPPWLHICMVCYMVLIFHPHHYSHHCIGSVSPLR